jgi:hypothetical protein
VTEEQLAQIALAWLQQDGWEVWGEIAPWGGGARRADLVATRGPFVTIVEVKLTLSLKLLDQASYWTPYAHYVWAFVPWKSGVSSSFAKKALEWQGVGLMTHTKTRGDLRMVHPPTFNRKALTRTLRSALVDEQKGVVGGTNSNIYSTPFRRTCDELYYLVQRQGGRMLAQEAFKKLKHHYSSDRSARGSLIPLIEKGVVEGLGLEHEGKDLFFIVVADRPGRRASLLGNHGL